MIFEAYELGTVYSLPPVPITQEEVIDFATKYDPLPIHMDAQYAATTKFGRIIAPGVMSFMRVWAEFLRMGVVGDELIAGRSTHIEWLAPVYPGDTLTGQVEVTGLTPRNPYNGQVEVTTTIVNQAGIQVISNVTCMIVRRQREDEL